MRYRPGGASGGRLRGGIERIKSDLFATRTSFVDGFGRERIRRIYWSVLPDHGLAPSARDPNPLQHVHPRRPAFNLTHQIKLGRAARTCSVICEK